MTLGPRFRTALAAACAVVGSVPLSAQPADGAGEGPFVDPGAGRLWEAAVAHRTDFDDSLVQYVAVVKQRMAAALRMPLKDRTLYRAEGASRVFWSRGGNTVVQVLGAREQNPFEPLHGVEELGLFDQAFDPLNDRLFFGLAEVEEPELDGDDFWFEHPLEPVWRDGYRFRSGDTITVTIPSGERLQVVELEVVPVVADVHRMVGSLWIEPESGALVRAVYRLSDTFDAFRDIPDLQEEEEEDLRHIPELLKPWTVELALMAVDYGWWEGDVWLPRTFRAEGTLRVGFLSAPLTMEVAYRIESLVTEAELAAREAEGFQGEERHFRTKSEALEFLAERLGDEMSFRLDDGFTRTDDARGDRTVRYLVPEDPDYLLESPHLPPPVWEEGAPGFAAAADLDDWKELLGDLPAPPVQGVPWTFRWGLQRTDLTRYNRVEGLSVGARGQIRPNSPLGPLSVTATARLATADLEPTGRLDVAHETLARATTLSGYHELATVDEGSRHLGPGNSLNALLFGRDDGDYYRRSGASLAWTPPAAERQSWEVRGYAEYHRPVGTETDFALWHLTDDSLSFRDNLQATEGWEMGGLVALRPWWGTDPRLVQGGLDLVVQGAGGDWEYARASLEGRLAVPLASRFRLGLEAAGGTSWGDPPPQRSFLLGAAATLRGYAPRTLAGSTYLRTRVELGRHYSFGTLSVFSDAGWAGDERRLPDGDELLWSVGTGLSLVDGLIRLDAAWGLRAPKDFRLELYLDGIL